MKIDTLVVGPLEANCYILSINNLCLIIDPGEDDNKIISHIKENNFTPVGIIITHNHKDHNSSVNILKEMYDIKSYDYNTLFEQKHFLNPFNFKVIYTLGHTKDSISFYFYEYGCLFTGDFLFKETIGRCDLEDSSELLMIESLKKIKQLSPDTVIYPGHGEKTKLANELKNNNYLKGV